MSREHTAIILYSLVMLLITALAVVVRIRAVNAHGPSENSVSFPQCTIHNTKRLPNLNG